MAQLAKYCWLEIRPFVFPDAIGIAPGPDCILNRRKIGAPVGNDTKGVVRITVGTTQVHQSLSRNALGLNMVDKLLNCSHRRAAVLDVGPDIRTDGCTA